MNELLHDSTEQQQLKGRKKEKKLCGTKNCPEIAEAPNFTKRYVEGLSELAVTAPNRFHQSQRAKKSSKNRQSKRSLIKKYLKFPSKKMTLLSDHCSRII